MAGKSSKKRIGLYGGTFDPIHLGHLNLAFEIKEKSHLDEVWFIPTYINPHKIDNKPVTTFEERIHMLQLAIEDIPFFKIKDLESHREPPSYTIDTLRDLLKNQQDQFYLLLGQDSIPGFFHWKLVNEIVNKVPLLIASRSGNRYDFEANGHDPVVCKAIQDGLIETKSLDISSTDIRKRLREGLYCGHLLPGKVYAYIVEKGLYL